MDGVPKIDVHAHLFEGKSALKLLIENARKLNYKGMCLSATGKKHSQVGNDAVFEAAKHHSDVIWPFPWVDLDKADSVVVDEYKERGAKGLKVIDPLLPYNHPNYLPVFTRAGELGLPVLFHSGIKARLYDGPPSANVNHRPAFIDDAARRCPKTKMIMAHISTPWHDESLMTARINPNVYIDLSSGSGWEIKGMNGEWFRRAFWWKGAWKKVLFASDVTPDKLGWAVKVYDGILEGIGADEEVWKDVFYRNAERLWQVTDLSACGHAQAGRAKR
jgi:predicted TIM-barrel fold metal-dependent hydrolase